MATATIVNAWQDASNAYLAVSVAGDTKVGGQTAPVEYVASVPLAALVGLNAAAQKAALVTAVKAVRDAQVGAASSLGLSGSVTV